MSDELQNTINKGLQKISEQHKKDKIYDYQRGIMEGKKQASKEFFDLINKNITKYGSDYKAILMDTIKQYGKKGKK